MTAREWDVVIPAPVGGPKVWLSANDRMGHWRRRSVLTAEWRRRAGWTTKSDGVPRCQRVHIIATLYFGDQRRRDVGNYAPTVKAAIDGVVAAGVIPDDDDTHLVGPDIRRGDFEAVLAGRLDPTPRVVLTIRALDPGRR